MAGRYDRQLNRERRSARQSAYDRQSYVQGSAVRQEEYVYAPEREYERARRKKVSPRVRRNREKVTGMSFSYVCMLLAVSLLTVVLCGWMLMIKSDITTSKSNIKTLNSTLTSLKTTNDAAQDEIAIYTDLDYIYKVATKKLGMTYPSDDQIILYDQTESEYVRQYENIPTDDK